jgi:hypothetical protein
MATQCHSRSPTRPSFRPGTHAAHLRHQARPAQPQRGQARPTAATGNSPGQAAFHASSSLSRAPTGPGIGPHFAQMRRYQARRCPLRYRQRRLGNAGVIQIGELVLFPSLCSLMCQWQSHARTCTYARPEFAATPFSPSWLVMAACGSATTEPCLRDCWCRMRLHIEPSAGLRWTFCCAFAATEQRAPPRRG